MASTAASAHPFTCNTCQVAFRSSDLQRTHMQSDWHRYNLKRRVASLPPLTSEIFAEKVLANKASAAATAARASFEKKCDPCDKVFFSEGAFVNHVGSQKHKNAAARYGKYTRPFGDQARPENRPSPSNSFRGDRSARVSERPTTPACGPATATLRPDGCTAITSSPRRRGRVRSGPGVPSGP